MQQLEKHQAKSAPENCHRNLVPNPLHTISSNNDRVGDILCTCVFSPDVEIRAGTRPASMHEYRASLSPVLLRVVTGTVVKLEVLLVEVL